MKYQVRRMKAYLISLVCIFVVMSELASASSNSLAWRDFKRQHGKVYRAEEDAMRFANFLATKQLIQRHNANSSATFKMGLNHMSDWTREEYQRITGRLSKVRNWDRSAASDIQISPRLVDLLNGAAPDEVDWRKVPNRVSEVKDQNICPAGWAFATTGLLEGQQVVRNFSKLVPLSEQELIDCSTSNAGCSGGLIQFALEDIAQFLGGIESEADYSYEARNNICRIDLSRFIMNTKGGHLLKTNDESALLKAVANYGPVAVAIDANENFMHYESGIFTNSDCEVNNPNHGLLVVGYGTDSRGGDYWIVKNSWGTSWGEEGYMKMKRGVNLCGIAQYSTLADF